MREMVQITQTKQKQCLSPHKFTNRQDKASVLLIDGQSIRKQANIKVSWAKRQSSKLLTENPQPKMDLVSAIFDKQDRAIPVSTVTESNVTITFKFDLPLVPK